MAYSYYKTSEMTNITQIVSFVHNSGAGDYKYGIIIDGGHLKYFDGLNWVDSDGSWAELSSSVDFVAGLPTLPLQTLGQSTFIIFISNDDISEPNPELGNLEFETVSNEDVIYPVGVLLKFRTIMLGNGKRSNLPIRIQLSGYTRTQTPMWKNQTIDNTRQLIYTDINGEAEIYLPPNDEISPINLPNTFTYYNIRIGNNNAVNIYLENIAATQYFDQITPL